jgi:hypothetical protein
MLSKTRITILALTGAIAMTGVAEAAPKSKLTIKGPNGDFQGTIKASKRKCMNNRTVHVFMKTDAGPQEIGSDTSELNSEKTRGLWSTGNSGYKNGEFFAKAGPKGSCAPLKSKTITVVTPDADEPDSGESTTARTVRGDAGVQLQSGVGTKPIAMTEVDGAEGGMSRAECEKWFRDWEALVEDVSTESEQGDMEAASKSLDLAIEIHDLISDNCLIVD